MFTNKNAENAKIYECKKCIFVMSKESDWKRHINTRKHINTYNDLQKNAENAKLYICNNCNKEYSFRQSLYTHKKKCKENTIIKNTIIDESINDEINNDHNMKDIILNMVKSNQELQKQIIEVCKANNNSNKIITNNLNNSVSNNNTMTNSNNKTFNLQVFLNEQCKDAMNLSDFMESIQLSLEDLENMEKLGYVECMFKNIFGDMDFISIFDRPFHCSDFKRGIIYIKENGVWEKEDAGYTRLINAIRIVEKKNFKLLKEWAEKHPSFSDYNSPDNDKYVKIFGETMSGDKHNLSKLIRKLTKSCVIDKSSL